MITKLSICIATYNRANFIGETLNSIITQLCDSIEIVVVDGASPDKTFEVMKEYLSKFSFIRYFRENKNSGVDADYDKAVQYARGEYCWLMTDDDILKPGAIEAVLESIRSYPELVVVNSEVKNFDFSKTYVERSLIITDNRNYEANDGESFFVDIASYLSFIGAVVIKREVWLARDRVRYYGSLFIHVGIIFQSPPLTKMKVISSPFITIRYGNAMWSPRTFEIWTFKWPNLIWSFVDFSDESKNKITKREPRKSFSRLFRNRALGVFSTAEVKKFWPDNVNIIELAMANLIAIFPRRLANIFSICYLKIEKNTNKMALHDLLNCRHSNFISKCIAKDS
jgi:abequosyltransferase